VRTDKPLELESEGACDTLRYNCSDSGALKKGAGTGLRDNHSAGFYISLSEL
jgi:hypothetical protein